MQSAPALSIFATALIVLASGCKSEPKPVSFYLGSDEVRAALIKECKDDVTRATTDGDCLNALEAQTQILVKKAREQEKAYNAYLEKRLKESQAKRRAEWEALKAERAKTPLGKLQSK